MLTRYAVFAYSPPDTCGGWFDLVSLHPLLSLAIVDAERLLRDKRFKCAHVVDLKEAKMVWES